MARFFFLTLTAIAACVAESSPFGSKTLQTVNTPKAKMMAKLMENALPTDHSQISRGLEQGALDLSNYVIKYEKCQFIKSYDDELAQDEDASTILSTKRFVIFRLCPSDSCNSCNENFGEYVVDLATYLEIAAEYALADRENSCGVCNQLCQNDDDVSKNNGIVNCNDCVDYCEEVQNLQNNGFVESYEFAECIQLYDNGQSQIFAGAQCTSRGLISIGAFSDQDCTVPDKSAEVEDYIGNGLSFNNDILKAVSDKSSCVSCVMKNYDADFNGDDVNVDAEMNEMCQNLYDESAKCESKYGFDNYWKDYEDYANQYIQEDLVCDFISSLKKGSYDQYGEIVLTGLKRTGSGQTSGSQKFALSVFLIGSILLGFYSARINTQLKKSAKADLSAQGGAMA